MNQDPLHPITNAQVEAYERDGAIVLRGQYDDAWLGYLNEAIEAARALPGPFAQDHTVAGEEAAFYSDLAMSHRVPAFRRFALEGPGPAMAARLMRSERVNFFYDALWVKEAGTTRTTPWHHDQPSYQIEGRQVCLIWLPLQPVAREVCLETVAGSHRWGRSFRVTRINGGYYDSHDGDPLEPAPDIDGRRADYRILAWALEPGDAIAFHGMTLHGSAGNSSALRRAAVSTVWAGEDVTYTERPSEMQPRFEGHGLTPGDPIDCAFFPRAWPREAMGRPA